MRSFTANASVASPVSTFFFFFSSSFFAFKRSGTAIPSTIRIGCKQVKAGVTVAVAGDSASSRLSPIPVRRRQLLYLSAVSFLVPFREYIFMQRAAAYANAAGENHYIMEEILKVLSKGKAAGVLRLVFHDAGTYENNDKRGGMNGSIVYELDRPENKGLNKSVKILEKAKSQIDIIRPSKNLVLLKHCFNMDIIFSTKLNLIFFVWLSVSWSDIIAVAGAVAVSLCGGPSIAVKLGRIDSSGPDPEGKLPEETLDAVGLKKCFQLKGFSTQELVALSGAHTLGSKGFGDPFVFDNSYFKILLEKPWLPAAGMSAMIGLPSDRALVEDDECKRWITEYANNQELFFEDFKNAYIKLVNAGARWNI